ncbi:MAG: nucleotidyltransferase substrate binding protein [Deltaproteobacteria bacterium]|nr:nucleotidyltransferase substrate binding protein [Deltaproteobacteria bacterium]
MDYLDLSSLRRAIESFANALSVLASADSMSWNTSQIEVLRAGVIQNFEFTYELSWKFIQRWLTRNLGRTETEGISRRHLFRLAAQHRLINDVDTWMDYHQARNETVHTYDSFVAQAVIDTAKEFINDVRLLLERIKASND